MMIPATTRNMPKIPMRPSPQPGSFSPSPSCLGLNIRAAAKRVPRKKERTPFCPTASRDRFAHIQAMISTNAEKNTALWVGDMSL